MNGKEVLPEQMMGQFSFVPSDSILFTGTLYENLTMGDPGISGKECINWVKKFGLESWFPSWEKGLYERVKEEGSNLSGGQRQMICILRAFLADKPIIVLDEPFSALDQDRSNALKRVLCAEKENRIIILTSHRIHTLDICDTVYQMGGSSGYKSIKIHQNSEKYVEDMKRIW